LRSQIQAINNKKSLTSQDKQALELLEKELQPIEDFLGDARKQRDAILKDIGMYYLSVIIAYD
jgi:hypothetical protein